MHLVLASQSPARLATLRSAGLDPRVRASRVDEDRALADATERFGALVPADAVLVLARAKAEDVAETVEAAAEADFVVGCDSMLELDGELMGKPADAAEARDRWRRMRGRTGDLHTGHWLIDVRPDGTGATFGATATTTVHFASLSDEEIDAYIATGEPLRVAGAFTVDGLGGPYVERIEGDYHNVVGISLPLLRGMFAEIGVSWTQLRG